MDKMRHAHDLVLFVPMKYPTTAGRCLIFVLLPTVLPFDVVVS
jgi:hypothetical protein